MATDKIFTKGMFVKPPRDNAPDFVKGSVSFKAAEFVAFLREHVDEKGWVNVDLKVGQSGKWYAELNTWKPKSEARDAPITTTSEDMDDVIPF